MSFLSIQRSIPLQCLNHQLEMRRLNMAFAGSAHDVVKHRGEFQNLESLLANITVATNIAIAESQNVPELVRQGPRRQIAGAERDIPSNEAMRRLSSRRQYDAVDRKTAGMGSCIDVSAGLRNILVAIDIAERYIPHFNL